MSFDELRRKLQKYSHGNVELVLKNNRSTYLSIRKKGRDLKLSLHRGFLYATEEVCRAVMGYTLLDDPRAGKTLRYFSHQMFDKVEAPIVPDREKLLAKGKYFDLSEIYDEVNAKYFESSLKLSITWFKKPKYRTYRSITYGTYDRAMKLVRINQILDRTNVPKYYVAFVVYHEMLHEVCPAYMDKSGKRIVHTPLFKQKEKEFVDYKKARLWEKNHGRA